MDIGISSSCFYPEVVETSLENAAKLGAKTAEVFMNSYCELEGGILKKLCNIRKEYAMNIRSVHPFTSAYETVMIFSGYERRTRDSIEFYKRYFDAANALGAEIVVIHGGKCVVKTTPEKYAESYSRLLRAASEFGLYIAHENVKDHHCADPLFMKKVADLVGDDFRMVLDIKQCRRSGRNEFDFIRLLGEKIAQVHLSDCNNEYDCLPPGEGSYDFGKLFSSLKSAGYDNSAVIELYSGNYRSVDELRKAKAYLEKV